MFRALRVTRDAAVEVESVELTDDALMPGDVVVDVEYSSLNYKDALALAGKPGVIRSYPLIPGIDLVGTVASSDHPRWKAGDSVILNGWGIGESHHGGLAERARVNGDWLVALPDGIDARSAAAIGTAGFTAMLAVLALERAGVKPPVIELVEIPQSDDVGEASLPTGTAARFFESSGTGGVAPSSTHGTGGDILVTGAAGGVGSIAIALLAARGYRVTASTGRPQEADYLRRLGASEILDRATLSEPGKPLQTQHWAGAIDSVGGHTLANVLAQTNYGGTVASCGLAQSGDLPTTVMPFILRAVTLTGINSVFAPRELREQAWARLASDLDPGLLDDVLLGGMTETIGLADAVARSADVLAGRVRGRIVVDVRA